MALGQNRYQPFIIIHLRPHFISKLELNSKTVELEWCKRIFYQCLYLSFFHQKSDFRYPSLSFVRDLVGVEPHVTCS